MTNTRPSMWGGRFTAEADDRFRRLNDSLGFDIELLDEDVEASIAWARALTGAGVFTPAEADSVCAALSEIRNTLASGTTVPHAEDVHSLVEALLTERVGDLGRKLHTGRSRNDQVATDFRLYLIRAFSEAIDATRAIVHALALRAIEEGATPMPGYTHSRRAEPITFGHWCLAYAEMLMRDLDRFRTSRERANECPLGSGALAGTPLPVDRDAIAKALGFKRASRNSLDAVSDRDAAADYLYASSMLLVHLSRFAEDLIAFTSDEARFVELPDALATGSSRMPHKKNPDLLELARGYAGRSIGELTGLLALLKGLPLAYDKDLQLDKEPVFRTRAVLGLVMPLLASLVESMTIDRPRMRAAASDDLMLATEVADAMAARGVPFRDAHEVVSRRVGEAIERNLSLHALGPSAEITESDLAALDVDRAIAKKRVTGGTSPDRVGEAVEELLARLAVERSRED